MRVQHFLNLARVDVLAATDDHVLLAAHDVEIAILIKTAVVARSDPSVAQGVRGSRLVVPVTLHDLLAADEHLADLACGKRLPAVIDDPNFIVDLRPSCRGEPQLLFLCAIG